MNLIPFPAAKKTHEPSIKEFSVSKRQPVAGGAAGDSLYENQDSVRIPGVRGAAGVGASAASDGRIYWEAIAEARALGTARAWLLDAFCMVCLAIVMIALFILS